MEATPAPADVVLDDDDMPILPAPSRGDALVSAARARLAAGLEALRSRRTSWSAVVVACAASACVAASLAVWLTIVASTPHATTVTIQGDTAAAPAPASDAGAERAASVERRSAPRRAHAAAPVRSERRAERRAARDAAIVEVEREVAPPPGAGVADPVPASAEAALTPTVQPAADVPAPAPSGDATPDAADASDVTSTASTTDGAAAAAEREETRPAEHGDALDVTPIPTAEEGAVPVPAKAHVPGGGPEEIRGAAPVGEDAPAPAPDAR